MSLTRIKQKSNQTSRQIIHDWEILFANIFHTWVPHMLIWCDSYWNLHERRFRYEFWIREYIMSTYHNPFKFQPSSVAVESKAQCRCGEIYSRLLTKNFRRFQNYACHVISRRRELKRIQAHLVSWTMSRWIKFEFTTRRSELSDFKPMQECQYWQRFNYCVWNQSWESCRQHPVEVLHKDEYSAHGEYKSFTKTSLNAEITTPRVFLKLGNAFQEILCLLSLVLSIFRSTISHG